MINGRTFREQPLRFGDQLAVPGCCVRLARPEPRQRVVGSPHPDGASAVISPSRSQELRLSRPQAQRLLDQLQRADRRERWLDQQLTDRACQLDRLRQELEQQRNQHLSERRAEAARYRALLGRARRRAARRKKALVHKLRHAQSEWKRKREKIERRLARYRELISRRQVTAPPQADPGSDEQARQRWCEQQTAEIEARATEIRAQAASLEQREAELMCRQQDIEARLHDVQQQHQRLEEQREELQLRTAELSQSAATRDQQQHDRSAELERWQGELEGQQAALVDAQSRLDGAQQQLRHEKDLSADESRQRLQGMESSLADAYAEIKQLTDHLSHVLAEKELTNSELHAVKAQLESLARSEQDAREALLALQADLSRPSGDGHHESEAWNIERQQLQSDLSTSQQAFEALQQESLVIQRELEQLRMDSRAAEESWVESRDEWTQQQSAWQEDRTRWEALASEQRVEIARLSDLEKATRDELQSLRVEWERLQDVVDHQTAELQQRSDAAEIDGQAQAAHELEITALRDQLAQTQALYEESSSRLATVLADSQNAAELQKQFEYTSHSWEMRERELMERLETLEQMQLRAEDDRNGWEYEWKQLASEYEQQLAELRAELQRMEQSQLGGHVNDVPAAQDAVDDDSDGHSGLIDLELDGLASNEAAGHALDGNEQPASNLDEHGTFIGLELDALTANERASESVDGDEPSDPDADEHGTLIGLELDALTANERASESVDGDEPSDPDADEHGTFIGLELDALTANERASESVDGDEPSDPDADEHGTLIGLELDALMADERVSESVDGDEPSDPDAGEHGTLIGLELDALMADERASESVDGDEPSDPNADEHGTLIGLELDALASDEAVDHGVGDEESPPDQGRYEPSDTASLLAKLGFREDDLEVPPHDKTGGEPDLVIPPPRESETLHDSELQSLIDKFRAAGNRDESDDAEASADEFPSSADDEDDSAAHDESIEVYMQRLLGRKWKESPSQPDLPVAVNEKPKRQEQSADPVEEAPREKPRLPPKRENPMRTADLSAMRELANASTRDAILKHAKSQRGWQVATQVATSIIPFLSGVILIILGQSLHVALMVVGALLMLGSIGISVYHYRKWSRFNTPQRRQQETDDESSSEELDEEFPS